MIANSFAGLMWVFPQVKTLTFKKIKLERDNFEEQLRCNKIMEGVLGEKLRLKTDEFEELKLKLSLKSEECVSLKLQIEDCDIVLCVVIILLM